MSESFNRRETSIDVPAHQLFYKVTGLSANVVPHRILKAPITLTNCGDDRVFCSSLKGWLSAQHDVNDDTDAPYVTLFCVGAAEDFWSYVVGCSVHLVHDITVTIIVMRGTKVDDFYRAAVLDVDKNVLRLQVTMSYVLSMTVSDCLQELLGHVSSLCL